MPNRDGSLIAHRRILIAEDEALIAEELSDRVRTLGYQVVGAVVTGEDAVERARAERPDLVLMDIRMRGRIDGVEAAGRIRSSLNIPAIFLTAHSDESTLDRAARTAPLGYLIKPVGDRELAIAIQMAFERIALERTLRASEQRYATTLTSIGDAVIATDAQGQITFMNPMAAALTGWPVVEAAELPLSRVFRAVDAASRKPLEDPVAAVAREQRILQLGSTPLLVARNGSTTPIDASASPIREADGSGVGVVVVFRDCTERLRAQDIVRQAEEQIRLAQKMDAIGRLAGGVAHDINNMMTVVTGFGELVLAQLPADSPLRELVAEMKTAGERAAVITRQLLAFSRRQVMAAVPLDLNEIITSMRPMLSRLIGSDVSILADLVDNLRPVLADRGQMEQFILNLVLNARDAMPNGGEIHFTTANVQLDGPSPKAGEYALLSVRDTGVGMTPETRSRIFEPFFTTKEFGRGAGLGLATAYGIVKQMGGTIDVVTTPGRGSAFTAYFPAARASVILAPRVNPRDPVVGGKETILVADEEESIRRMTRHSLQELGYSVLTATTAEEVLSFVASAAPIDLLLIDAKLPPSGGRTLAQRALQTRSTIKVLFLSGSVEDPVLQHEMDTGRVAYISKPFAFAELAASVRRALGKSV